MMLKKVFAFLASFAFLSSALAALPAGYENLSADQKSQILWNNVLDSEYDLDFLPHEWPGAMAILHALNPVQLLLRPFQRVSDEMPSPTRKNVHTHGSVALVEFVPAAHSSASGLLQGAIGLARVSTGKDPATGFLPGLAVKFFVDKKPSVNLHLMNSLADQGSHQFFERPFLNVLNIPLIGPFTLSVNSLVSVNRDGSSVVYPTQVKHISFFPTTAAREQYKGSGAIDFRRTFAKIEPVTLYKVFIFKSAEAAPQYVGDLNLVSRFVSSRYGDEVLFFKHTK